MISKVAALITALFSSVSCRSQPEVSEPDIPAIETTPSRPPTTRGGQTQDDLVNGVGTPTVDNLEMGYLRSACNDGHADCCSSLAWSKEQRDDRSENLTEIVQLYRRGCKGGSAHGCNNLGVLLDHGDGVTRDESSAFNLYSTACSAGYLLACRNAGRFYELGRVVERDQAAARRMFEEACSGDIQIACVNLAAVYLYGRGVPPDTSRAFQLLEKACNAGVADGCVVLADMLARGLGVPVDNARATQLLGGACQDDYSVACANLAFLQMRGDDSRKKRDAMALLVKLCEQDRAISCSNLGVVHELGLLTAPDLRAASEAYRKACDLHDQVGCANLASLLLQGEGGVQADKEAARELASTSCKATPVGCYALGVIHLLEGDWDESARLFEESCDGYVAKACFNLGLHYAEGAGVPKNQATARKLFRQACDGGVDQGCAKLR